MRTGRDRGKDQAMEPNPERIEAFAGHLIDCYGKGLVTFMIDVADRTGMLEALAQHPATSAELAARTGLNERYVRECLSALATGGIVEYEGGTQTFTLPLEHAVCLTGHTATNMAPLSRLNTLLGRHLDGIENAFRRGGGVSYEEFKPEFTGLMDRLGRATYDQHLIQTFLPLGGDLTERLTAGITAADIGCGTGHTTTLLARAFSNSTFTGYDFSVDAIEAARKEASEYGLTNVAFEVLDVTHYAPAQPVDAIFAFDAIHDQAKPAVVLRRIADALKPGGVFFMLDVYSSSNLEDNIGNPMAPLIYGISALHCMTVSLAQGGDGLGAAWGHQTATRMLAEAGLTGIEVHEVPDDPFNVVFLSHKR